MTCIAFATLLYSVEYLSGVCALGYQLRQISSEAGDNSVKCLIVLASLWQESLSCGDRAVLKSLFDEVVLVDLFEEQQKLNRINSENLELLQRPELANAILKIRLWSLTKFDQILYLDADTLPLDASFLSILDVVKDQTQFQIAGVSDIGWPDMFNTGVLSLVPDMDVFEKLQKFAATTVSIDGADQGILNQFFNQYCHSSSERSQFGWMRLPFVYNVTMPNYGYQYSPAMKYFQKKIKLVHFIGLNKPWKKITSNFDNRYFSQWLSVYGDFVENFLNPLQLRIQHSSDTESLNQINGKLISLIQHSKSKDNRVAQRNISNPENKSEIDLDPDVVAVNYLLQNMTLSPFVCENSNTENFNTNRTTEFTTIPYSDDLIVMSPVLKNKKSNKTKTKMILHPIATASDKLIFGKILSTRQLATPIPKDLLQRPIKKNDLAKANFAPLFDWEHTDYVNKVERRFENELSSFSNKSDSNVNFLSHKEETGTVKLPIVNTANNIFDWEDTDYLNNVSRSFPIDE